IPAGDSEPWRPFNSRLDFDFAELTHETHMNEGQIERLLDIVHRAVSNKDRFTFDNAADVDLAWAKARLLFPSFEVSTYPVDYKDEQYTFEFHHRPLWPWLMSQVQDPLLAKHWRWDAQRLYKYNGTEWVRFYDEPWTAESFSKAQSRITMIDPNGKPFAIILWADTSKLSTFGTQKGHFIIARAGNLPEFIRNGSSIGGGRIVGFVPLIANEDPGEKGKVKYINFKHAVYHEAWHEFLKDVALYSRTGYHVACGDTIPRSLFPYIHIVVADYQEQCYFCLLRGLRGLAPCPVCLIPKGMLSNITTKYAYRVASEVQALVEKEERKGVKEKVLKNYGLRAVKAILKNALWDIENTDVHAAMSFDRLHAYTLGLFQDHLIPQLKLVVASLDRSASVQIENSVKGMPPWPELSHFNGILSLDFGDGKKWDDIAKFIVNVIHHVLTPQKTQKGFALLRLIRKFVELNRFLSMEVQTTKTIAAFRRTLKAFHARLQDYKHECQDDEQPKDWDAAIKVHSHTHAPRDIIMKGVLSNMDTKPNEQLNGPMRKAYQLRTNFKNVEGQLGKIDDKSLASCSIRAHIDALDSANAKPPDDEPKISEFQFNNVYLGSRIVSSVEGLLQGINGDRAFDAFKSRLSVCVNELRVREGKGFKPVNNADK
ncbi:hypothetical protein BDY19DRAFT_959866, partial [Irpex rosettiformis]